MFLFVPLAIVLLGGLVWASMERGVVRRAGAEAKQQAGEDAKRAAGQAEEERLERIRNNPRDHLEYSLNKDGPNRRGAGDAVADANAAVVNAKEQLEEVARDFPGGSNPNRKWVILMLGLAALYVGGFVAQIALDYPIFHSITGNPVNAMFMTVVIVGILAAASLALTLLWDRRTGANAVSARVLRGGTVGIITLFVVALSIVVLMAPKRAEIDYADRIEEATQQIAVFQEDGDATAEAFMKAKLARFESERDQAAHVYQGLALSAGAFEFLAGFAAPTGLQLLQFFAARKRVRRLVKVASDVTHARDQHAELFRQGVSQEFYEAGVFQDRLQFGADAPPAPSAPLGLPPPQPQIPPGGGPPERRGPERPRPPARPPAPPQASANNDATPPDDPSFDQS